MKALLFTLVLVMQNAAPPSPQPSASLPIRLKDATRDFPRSQFQPPVTTPISIELNQPVRMIYQALADAARINVVFDPDLRNDEIAFRSSALDIHDALDRLSMQTGNFVEVLESKTILVAPNNATKRRENETLVLKTLHPAGVRTQQDLAAIVTTLRTTLNMRYVAPSVARNAVIIRDSPDRVAEAEKIVTGLGGTSPGSSGVQAVAVNVAGRLLTLDAAGIHTSSPAHGTLQPKQALVNLSINNDARAAFEALAELAGINIVFDRDWRPSPAISLKFQNVATLDALDYLCLETSSFWESLDNSTVLISPRNQTKRRDYARMTLKSVRLANGTTPQETTEIVTALRTLLNMRYIAQVPSKNTIAMMETPAQLALADILIAELSRTPAPAPLVAATVVDAGNETGGILRRRAVRNLAPAQVQIQPRAASPVDMNMSDDAQKSFERLADLAGLRVNFESRFMNVPMSPLKLRNVGIIDALDFLSLQTGTFWQPLDSATIVVAPDNQSTRRDIEPRVVKTFNVSSMPRAEDVQEIVIALRTLLNASDLAVAANTIVMRDTAENVAIAERLIVALTGSGNR
jgi:type II secretory pathway component GspD/PulD (secretin)